MSNAPKTVLAIHDLPGFGRAALSVIVPVLSCLGVQAVALPTAVLSTHTGGLGTPAKLSNPGYGPAALAHYQRLGLRFDCIYSGYLASPEQAELLAQTIDCIAAPDTLVIVDPVMADNGIYYSQIDDRMCAAFRRLLSRADVITPNITEACLLTGLEYRETHDDSYIRTLLERLLALGARTAILTGVRTEPDRVGVACMDAAGAVSQCSAPYVPAVFYGTGDLFASTCAGALTLGWSVHDAMELASAYVADTIAETRREPDARWYGVSFEATIPQLLRRMAQRRPSHAEN